VHLLVGNQSMTAAFGLKRGGVRQWLVLPALGLLLAGSGLSMADDRTEVSIFISHTGNDAIGQHSAALLERMIKASPAYRLAPSHAAMMRISLASIDLDAVRAAGLRSAISTVITMRNYLSYDPSEPQTWYPIFLADNLVLIGTDGVDDYADTILDRIGTELRRYRKDVRKYQ
jgi:hypothetical protein